MKKKSPPLTRRAYLFASLVGLLCGQSRLSLRLQQWLFLVNSLVL
jgi:hypothetical protein